MYQDNKISINKNLTGFLVFCGILGIVMGAILQQVYVLVAIVTIPFIFIFVTKSLEKPVFLMYLIWIFGYWFLTISRYYSLEGKSYLFDMVIWSTLVVCILHSAIKHNMGWHRLNNFLIYSLIVWFVYCFMEVMNPHSNFENWYHGRELMYNFLFMAGLSQLLITKIKQVKVLISLLAVFTLMAIIKSYIQKYIGFDYAELEWLSDEHIHSLNFLQGGVVRYFSIFSDAGVCGSTMAATAVWFGITAFYNKNKTRKIYYYIIAVGSIMGMLFSGTRGAIICPLGGIGLFSIVSGNKRLMTGGIILLIFIYSFLAFTYIGESVGYIRRLRTAVHPTEDASFNVRLDNQKILANYLKDKPFGIGLRGIARASVVSEHGIPSDSYYVLIWINTGVVGLVLFLASALITIIIASYIIMFKIKNKELKELLIGPICAIFGILLSSYTNNIWGQFPVFLLIYIFLGIIFNYKIIDKNILEELNTKKLNNNNSYGNTFVTNE